MGGGTRFLLDIVRPLKEGHTHPSINSFIYILIPRTNVTMDEKKTFLKDIKL